MKILIALPYFPYPINSGGTQATFHIINYLKDYFQITLVCPGAERTDVDALKTIWPDVTIIVTTYYGDQPGETNYQFRARAFYNKFKAIIKPAIKKIVYNGNTGGLEVCNQVRRFNMRLYRNNFFLESESFINRFQQLV